MRSKWVCLIAVLVLVLTMPVSAELVNRYSFVPVEGDPNVIDSVGGKHGIPVGTIVQANGDLVLDGTNYVSLPADVLADYTSATVETWYTHTIEGGSWFRVWDFGATEGTGGGWYWMHTPSASGQGASLTISTGGFPGYENNREQTARAAVVPPFVRVHMACVYDLAAQQMRMYRNGEMVASIPVQRLLSDVRREKALIGASTYTADPLYQGAIHEFRISNSVLNDTQITLNAQVDPDTFAFCALTSMSPANGAKLVPIPTALSWVPEAGIDVDHFEVYVLTDPNLLDPNSISVPASGLVYSGSDLTFSKTGNNLTTYFWRVDTVAADTTRYVGPMYSFETVPAVPVFTVNPMIASAPVGGSAVFTATATSPSGLTKAIQWFKSPDQELVAGGDIAISETVDGVLTTSTLTLSNIAEEQAGTYFAKATNVGGSANSTNARLTIQKLVAYYPFDGDANDASGNNLHGTPKANAAAPNNILPTYLEQADSITGQSIVLSNSYQNYIDLPVVGFADFQSGLTINLWAYPTAASSWARFIEISNGAPRDNIFFCRSGTGTTLQFRTSNGTSENTAVNASGAIALNQWQMFTATITPTSATRGDAQLYKNGLPIGSPVNIPLPPVVERTVTYIGRSAWSGDAYYTGRMDEVRIYNYGKTPAEILAMYLEFRPYACSGSLTYDFDGNCKVDLADFARFATQWLSCNRVPVDTCLE